MLLAFIASSVVTIYFALYHVFLRILWGSFRNPVDQWFAALLKGLPFVDIQPPRDWIRTAIILERIVLSLSDQQLLTGLAMVIAGVWNHCTITTYHLALVDDLAWFSVSVHLASVDVLRRYFHSHSTLRNWRVAFMLVQLLFMLLYAFWEAHYEWYSSCVPAQCVLDDLGGNIYGSSAF